EEEQGSVYCPPNTQISSVKKMKTEVIPKYLALGPVNNCHFHITHSAAKAQFAESVLTRPLLGVFKKVSDCRHILNPVNPQFQAPLVEVIRNIYDEDKLIQDCLSVCEIILRSRDSGLSSLLETSAEYKDIGCDMLLVGNQFPLEALNSIFHHIIPKNDNLSVYEELGKLLHPILLRVEPIVCFPEGIRGENILDLMWNYATYTVDRAEAITENRTIPTHNLSILRDRGIKIKKVEGHFLDIRIHGVSTLHIPPVNLSMKVAERVLSNFMDLEVCKSIQPITSYVVLMSNLVATEDDLEYLVQKKIIILDAIDYSSVIKMFKDLVNSKAIYLSRYHFKELSQKLNMYKPDWISRAISGFRK
ncbi:hypothetical protein MKW92_036647, partial [Papaver armeniacum]